MSAFNLFDILELMQHFIIFFIRMLNMLQSILEEYVVKIFKYQNCNPSYSLIWGIILIIYDYFKQILHSWIY